MTSTRKRRLFFWRVVRVGLLSYLGLLVLLAGCQRRYIYYPHRAGETELLAAAETSALAPWRDETGALIGWNAPAPGGSGPLRRAVVFHGNAGMAVERSFYAEGLQSVEGEERWVVYVFEYPGYGARGGKPGEEAFYRAARKALTELLANGDEPVYLIGESLGSGVACQMAADFPEAVDGVLLVTPFNSLAAVASHHFPFLPVRFFLRDRYDNVATLEDYQGPVAVLLAGEDEVVPVDLGRGLFESYSGPKKLWIQEGRTHNTLHFAPGDSWWGEVTRFWDEEKEGAGHASSRGQ